MRGSDEMHYVWMVIVGFVVGLIARALLPGTQSLGIILTAVLGIAGSLVAGFAGQALGWYQPGEAAGLHQLGDRRHRGAVGLQQGHEQPHRPAGG